MKKAGPLTTEPAQNRMEPAMISLFNADLPHNGTAEGIIRLIPTGTVFVWLTIHRTV
jgi:hypothetical protein